jgi:hypothetical protein
MVIDELMEMVERGMKGNPDFLTVGTHPVTGKKGKISRYINFGKRMYVLFGGMPGTGKTAIVDYVFVLGMYRQWKAGNGPKPFFIYRSMERNTVWKMAKWTCLMMMLDHGIMMDVATMIGMPGALRTLTSEDVKIIESYREFWEEFNDHIVIRDGSVTVEEAGEDIERIMHQKGDLIKTEGEYVVMNGKNIKKWEEARTDESKGFKRRYVEFKGQRIYEGDMKYFPYDEEEIVIHITDHIGKYKKDDKTDNQVIDAHADMVADARDLYGMAIVDISQFNRNVHDTYRKVKTNLTVNEGDFRGCSKPYHNCDIAIGMLSPWALDKGDHEGFYMKAFVSEQGHCRFRDMKIVKNNWGPEGISVALAFFGENGYIHELPADPQELTEYRIEEIVNGINLFV